MPSWTPWAIVGLWAIWLLIIILIGQGYTLWPKESSFAQVGSFGDAFGSLGSLMAALAAAGAILTLSQQQEQSERQNFENNFFSLLNHFQSLTHTMEANNWIMISGPDGTDIPTVNYTAHGHQALRAILDDLRIRIDPLEFCNHQRIRNKYKDFYNEFVDDLGHYFRLLYHLFKLIVGQCPYDEARKYYYAQIVRAHLSAPELTLLAYNCICGEGSEKFTAYLSRFSLLHNIHFGEDYFGIAERAFIQVLPLTAFDSKLLKLSS